MQKQGLLPNGQKALTIMGWVGYHDYVETTTDAGKQPRIERDVGNWRLLILRNRSGWVRSSLPVLSYSTKLGNRRSPSTAASAPRPPVPWGPPCYSSTRATR